MRGARLRGCIFFLAAAEERNGVAESGCLLWRASGAPGRFAYLFFGGTENKLFTAVQQLICVSGGGFRCVCEVVLQKERQERARPCWLLS